MVDLDEHFFRRERKGFASFVTMVVDQKNHRLFELIEGKRGEDLRQGLEHIPGREHVKTVVCDLADPYKSIAKSFFPNAHVVADKFHVLRLLHPAINRYRKAAIGERRDLPARKLLLKNGHKLDGFTRRAILRWLQRYPELLELYQTKEAMHRLYRTRGVKRARKALIKLTDKLAQSSLPELKTLRRTLLSWGTEILNYFIHRRTNGITEGFNGKAKLVKRRAYGHKSFCNYRLRLLNTCA